MACLGLPPTPATIWVAPRSGRPRNVDLRNLDPLPRHSHSGANTPTATLASVSGADSLGARFAPAAMVGEGPDKPPTRLRHSGVFRRPPAHGTTPRCPRRVVAYRRGGAGRTRDRPPSHECLFRRLPSWP